MSIFSKDAISEFENQDRKPGIPYRYSKFYRINVLTLLLILSIFSTLHSVELIGDRPDFTESVESIPVRYLQLESGYTVDWNESSTSHSFPEMTLRFGLFNNLEGRIFNNSGFTEVDEDNYFSFEEQGLGLKYNFAAVPENANFLPGFSLIAEMGIPAGSHKSISDNRRYTVKAILGWALMENLSLGFNGNYSQEKSAGEVYDYFEVSFSLGIGLTNNIGMYLEPYFEIPAEDSNKGISYFNTGFTYLVHTRMQLDWRFGTTLSNDFDGQYSGFGIIYLWG